ncbi:uncharacterized protein LOC114817191 [Ornithorhynchus anatinus]|uniref:uncharacterized protein LOC114817191 n=1 Tax=Ornithorhynchus anatinus TaxID=9258 RepID=UPI0010A752D4|nr:uncharacterized protein LOC114817191 [Ornithorhynchus anatinus]
MTDSGLPHSMHCHPAQPSGEPPLERDLEELKLGACDREVTRCYEAPGNCSHQLREGRHPPAPTWDCPHQDAPEKPAQQPGSPTTTDSDMDLNAVLLPSGGTQLHNHTLPTTLCQAAPPPSLPPPCRDKGDPELCPSPGQSCPNKALSLKSTLPFSFGTSCRSFSQPLKLPPREPVPCRLEGSPWGWDCPWTPTLGSPGQEAPNTGTEPGLEDWLVPSAPKVLPSRAPLDSQSPGSWLRDGRPAELGLREQKGPEVTGTAMATRPSRGSAPKGEGPEGLSSGSPLLPKQDCRSPSPWEEARIPTVGEGPEPQGPEKKGLGRGREGMDGACNPKPGAAEGHESRPAGTGCQVSRETLGATCQGPESRPWVGCHTTPVEDSYGRWVRQEGSALLEQLRLLFLDDEGQHLALLDSGLALACRQETQTPGVTFLTTRNGRKLGTTFPSSKLFLYYTPDLHFYVTDQLSSHWFRVRDRITQEQMLMKKVPVVSDWQKLLHHFLFLPPAPWLPVPYAVLYDRNGSILYLMEDPGVLAVGKPPERLHLDQRTHMLEALSFLRFCQRRGLQLGDVASALLHTHQGVCFDPSGLAGSEGPCVFRKGLRTILELLLGGPQQEPWALEALVDLAYQCVEEDAGPAEALWRAAFPDGDIPGTS